VVGFPSDAVHAVLKDLFSRFIEENRKGREVCLDLTFGTLHAYPNSDLQFENCTASQTSNLDRYNAKVRNGGKDLMGNIEGTSLAASDVVTFTMGDGKSRISVRTPLTNGSSVRSCKTVTRQSRNGVFDRAATAQA
jgi:hypothetical protein